MIGATEPDVALLDVEFDPALTTFRFLAYERKFAAVKNDLKVLASGLPESVY